jgi:hypothetical protein
MIKRTQKERDQEANVNSGKNLSKHYLPISSTRASNSQKSKFANVSTISTY